MLLPMTKYRFKILNSRSSEKWSNGTAGADLNRWCSLSDTTTELNDTEHMGLMSNI